ncbi:MAG: hypothetical protein IJ575_05825 [Selenomonadaceae bacterium]|nr:hypothetical protein [Selenomonadaceae bacterium]
MTPDEVREYLIQAMNERFDIHNYAIYDSENYRFGRNGDSESVIDCITRHAIQGRFADFVDSRTNEIFDAYINYLKFPDHAHMKYFDPPKPELESLNVEDLFAQFDLDAIGKSTIKYYQAIINLSNAFLDHLQKLENISPDNKSMQKLKLTPEDLRGQIKDVRNKVENLKSQADQFFIQLDEVNNSPNSIQKLAELESMPRPSFEFIIENFVNIINKLSIHNLE